MISFSDVREAAGQLKGVANGTPVFTSRTLNRLTGKQVSLKCENFQRGGAFKFRGAFNAISRLSDEEQKRGVIAFSSGNHSQAVALAAGILGVPAVICMPSDAPEVKVKATRGYGAEILFYDRFKDDRETMVRDVAAEKNLAVIPPYDHPHIMAGAGTAALELLEETRELDAVIVPVGGGGLISGTAVAAHGLNSKIRIFGVEPEGADDTRRSMQVGRRISIEPPATIADGLRSTTPGDLTFPIIQHHVEEIVTVTDEEILDAMRFSLLRLKLVIEPSSATALAALLHHRLPKEIRRVGIILSGGNVDPALLGCLATNYSAPF